MSFAVPAIPIHRVKGNTDAPPKSKAERVAEDLRKLQIKPAWRTASGSAALASTQVQGKLGWFVEAHNKWKDLHFVLRDSFLFSFALDSSFEFVKPRNCFYVGNSDAISVDSMNHKDRRFGFYVFTETQDEFLFSAPSEEERTKWLTAIANAKALTHASLVKQAVYARCLAEQKGVGDVFSEDSELGCLSLFTNSAYIDSTPLTGGAEGWVLTPGLNKKDDGDASTFTKAFAVVHDSHFLLFHMGDTLIHPRAVLYLDSAKLTLHEKSHSTNQAHGDHHDHHGHHPHEIESEASFDLDWRLGYSPYEGDEAMFRLCVKSPMSSDFIIICVGSAHVREMWHRALSIGGHVTQANFNTIVAQKELLAATVLTPRQPPSAKARAPAQIAPPPSHDNSLDIQGRPLAPGAVQPFSEDGLPLIREPTTGHLIDPRTGEPVLASTPRYSAWGEELDPFNRPLPESAVSMFDSNGRPIGVGPDGNHYTELGDLVPHGQPHFDAQGNQLSQEVVNAADLIAPTIAVELRVQSVLCGGDDVSIDMGNASRGGGGGLLGDLFGDLVDPLGRPLYQPDASKTPRTVDGFEVPLTSRRVVVDGQVVEAADATPTQDSTNAETEIKINAIDHNGVSWHIGTVMASLTTNLSAVRHTIAMSVCEAGIGDFVFVSKNIPIKLSEEDNQLASKFAPELFLRSTNPTNASHPRDMSDNPAGESDAVNQPTSQPLPPAEKARPFSTKVEHLMATQRKQQKEEEQFKAILERVRNKTFLNPVKQ